MSLESSQPLLFPIHQTSMEKSVKKAVDKVNNHREDGEQAIHRTSKVVPIDERTKKGTGSVTPEPSKSQRE
jgi:hypothetical protein